MSLEPEGGQVTIPADQAAIDVLRRAAELLKNHQDVAEPLRRFIVFLESVPTTVWDEVFEDAGFLSPGQVAGLLRLSDIAVADWLKGGYFPGAMCTSSGRWWFDPVDVEAVRAELRRLRALNAAGIVEFPDLGDTEPDVPVF